MLGDYSFKQWNVYLVYVSIHILMFSYIHIYIPLFPKEMNIIYNLIMSQNTAHFSCGMSPAPLSIMPPAVLRYTHRKKRRKGSLKLSQICPLVRILSSSGMLKMVWQMDSMCLFSPYKYTGDFIWHIQVGVRYLYNWNNLWNAECWGTSNV